MDILNIYSISGLFNELYNPNVDQFHTQSFSLNSDNPLRRTNALFWAKLFSIQNLKHLITQITDAKIRDEKLSEKEKAIVANPNLFIDLLSAAPLKIVNQKLTERALFATMEQLEIFCRLMSKYIYKPFYLTIQEGFQEPNLSASNLVKAAPLEDQNPYLPFLKQEVFPIVKQANPKMMWINGQPKLSTIAIAIMAKQHNPNIFIALRFHSSEYFSLNKIDNLLLHNKALFSIIDCLVLDDSVTTCSLVEKAFLGKKSLEDCRNIIYKNRSTGDIKKSRSEKIVYDFSETINIRSDNKNSTPFYLSPKEIMNLKLNPNTACFWNKCTFCGINKKYKFILNQENMTIDQKLNEISKYLNMGIHYLWFEDEAILPSQLHDFANAIINRHLEFEWQVRSRIDLNFNDNLFKKLFKAGLREIRFGLESATPRIWKLMNKFPQDIDIDFIENIVKWCTSAGIHVHFPMIVGFPSETTVERIETYKFLGYLRKKYTNVSFNINVLMLDYSSEIFRNFSEYGINTLSFPCSPYDYLGNMVNFTCSEDSESRTSIDYKRNEFMRETLYPWLPNNALIQPYIFYRLSETIRDTLIWHSIICSKSQDDLCINYALNQNLSHWYENGEIHVYDWNTHRSFIFPEEDYTKLTSLGLINITEYGDDKFIMSLKESELILPISEE